MPRVGTVNYHVHKAERQAFEIDAGGVVGRMVSPELVTTEVPLTDLRQSPSEVRFDTDGVTFLTAPSQISDFSGT